MDVVFSLRPSHPWAKNSPSLPYYGIIQVEGKGGHVVTGDHAGRKTLREQRSDAQELEQYKLLVDSVQDYAIFMLDTNGYVRTWNKGAQRIKGYKQDEIVGKHFSSFYTAGDIASEKPKKELEIAVRFGRVEDEDWRIRKDGSRFWASVVITALRDKGGELVGFGKVTRDLTERKLHEDQLSRANTLLKAQQRDLEQLNQSKDEFISLASHQLRTPATAIKQWLGLYVEGLHTGLPPQHLDIIKKAYESNERQIQIVNDLLKVAQVDAGKVRLRLDEIDAVALAREIIEDFREIVAQRQQNIKLKAETKPGIIQADRRNLRMALENLISNASKYTYPKGTITIRLYHDDDTMKIAISDTGVGIARQDIPTLFGKFKRVPNALSDEVGGTGLGLYWASKIVQLHGGGIEVKSKVNVGSTFTVSLPTGGLHA